MKDVVILPTTKIFQNELDYLISNLRKRLAIPVSLLQPAGFTEAELLPLADQANVFLGPGFTPAMIEKASRLKLIQIPYAGVERVNFDCLRGRGITVCNSHSNAAAVAEHGMGLLFSLMKKIPVHDRYMRDGDWNRTPGRGPVGQDSKMLTGSTVLFAGYGNIAKVWRAMLEPYHCRFLAMSHSGRMYPELDEAGTPEDMERLANQADVVLNTLPLTPQTRGLLGERFFQALKPDAVLVTIGRACTVDETAVYNALKSGRLGGFASDVWWKEPPRGVNEGPHAVSHNFFEFIDNIVLSPHRAAHIDAVLPQMADVVENIVHLAKGEALINVVNQELGY